MAILRYITGFFNTDKTVYSHRNRTVEMVAAERGLDIEAINADTRALIAESGSVTAVIALRRRLHITTSAAWIYVDRLQR